MAVATVSLSEASQRLLTDLATQTGQSAQEVVDKALDAYHRQVFIEQVNAGYAALRADPDAWAELQAERRSMAGSLMDGLDAKEAWGEDGDLLPPPQGATHG